jgi:hypothetical protein
MKKAKFESDEVHQEYKREDSGEMQRGKCAKQLRESSNVVMLDPDVAEAFPTAQAVNETLRRLIQLAKANAHLSDKE